MYKCLECGSEFTDQTAYCEDYRNPSRKLGCPNRKTFFIKSNEKMAVRNFILTLASIFSIFGLVDSIYLGDVKSSLQFGVISILLAIHIYKYVPLQKGEKIEKA